MTQNLKTGVIKMIIEKVKLNKNGVEVGEEENPLAMRYFDDNGGLPNGNYDEDDIAGFWIHVEGEHTNYDMYAYRTIDDTTLIPVEIYRRKLIGKLTGERILLGAEWLEEAEKDVQRAIDKLEHQTGRERDFCVMRHGVAATDWCN
jgi:hypothetical protein